MSASPFTARIALYSWLLVAIGIALRLSMLGFDVRSGYDFDWHLSYVHWFTTHPWQLPPRELTPETYHPPLYYWLAAWLLRAGLPAARLGCLSICLSIATLLLLRHGLARFVAAPAARLSALALAAVLPASVHLAGMATAEALSNSLVLLALILSAYKFVSDDHRLSLSVALGAILGLALLTKISSAVLVVSLLLAVVVEFFQSRNRRRLLEWLLTFTVTIAVSSWFFMANHRRYGHAILDAAECGPEWHAVDLKDYRAIPYSQRRPLSFFGWTNEILTAPYGPIAFGSEPQLMPALVASTFVDSYNYGFARTARDDESFVRMARLKLRTWHWRLSIMSVCGGALIALTTLVVWLIVAARFLFRERAPMTLVMLALPALALLGQIHYTYLFPPRTGPIKGVYMQFASPALCVLFGVAIAFLVKRGRAGKIAVAFEVAALVAVALYDFYCRFA